MLLEKNKIEIPTEQIEDALREGAVPGFYGRIRISVHLNQTAAHEVDLIKEKVSVSDGEKQRESVNVIPVTNERLARVKTKIAELRDRFHLYCPVTMIEAFFQDGKLTEFAVTEVSDSQDPKIRFAAPGKAG